MSMMTTIFGFCLCIPCVTEVAELIDAFSRDSQLKFCISTSVNRVNNALYLNVYVIE